LDCSDCFRVRSRQELNQTNDTALPGVWLASQVSMTGVSLSKRHVFQFLLLFWSWYGVVVSWHILTLFICWLLYIYISVIFCHILSLSRYKWQWFKSSGDGALRANPDGAGEHDVTMRTRANQRLVKDKSKTSRRTV
jgi:hypothetical protein